MKSSSIHEKGQVFLETVQVATGARINFRSLAGCNKTNVRISRAGMLIGIFWDVCVGFDCLKLPDLTFLPSMGSRTFEVR